MITTEIEILRIKMKDTFVSDWNESIDEFCALAIDGLNIQDIKAENARLREQVLNMGWELNPERMGQ